MEPEIIPFNAEHLEVAKIRNHELSGILSVPQMKDRLKYLTDCGEAMTLMYDGRIITFSGFYIIWPGVAEVWNIPTIYLPQHARMFARKIKGYLTAIAETFNLHRMQTAAPDNELHERWLTWIGFTKEGTMPQYTFKKETYCMWGRLFKREE